jgi:hypothetical protein
VSIGPSAWSRAAEHSDPLPPLAELLPEFAELLPELAALLPELAALLPALAELPPAPPEPPPVGCTDDDDDVSGFEVSLSEQAARGAARIRTKLVTFREIIGILFRLLARAALSVGAALWRRAHFTALTRRVTVPGDLSVELVKLSNAST